MADQRNFILLPWITIIVITFQLVSDATAGKIILLFGFSVSITVLYFPITYIFSDVLTEVYGYAKARSVLWKTMFASIVAGLVYQLAAYVPSASGAEPDPYNQVFGIVPRVLIGGWAAVFVGEIANNYVMAKMKVATDGRHLWARAMASTLVGQLLNTVVFYTIALSGILPPAVLVEAILAGWLLKSAVEFFCLPITYWVCAKLKKIEGIDAYDRDTNFSPFVLDDGSRGR